MVREFHETFGHGIGEKPQIPKASVVDFRVDFIKKEANELLAGAVVGDLIEVADGLGDIQYVLDGFFLECGLQDKKDAIMAEIHRSNMSKGCATPEEAEQTISMLVGALGTSESDYEYKLVGDLFVVYRLIDNKVQKSINYSPPELKAIVYGVE